MSKVYVITYGEYSDYQILTVFDKKILAEEYCKFENKYGYRNVRMEEYELNEEENFTPTNGYIERYVYSENGELKKRSSSTKQQIFEKPYVLYIGSVEFHFEVTGEKDYQRYLIRQVNKGEFRFEEKVKDVMRGSLYYPINEKTNFDNVDKIMDDAFAKLKYYFEKDCEGNAVAFKKAFGEIDEEV